MANRCNQNELQARKLDSFSAADLGERLHALRPRLTSVARRFATSSDAAEDIVQNAFLKAWRRFDQFDGRSRFSTWMHRIVVNEALMWLRTERRRNRHQLDVLQRDEVLAESPPDPGQKLDLHQQTEQLRAGVAALPSLEREVIKACMLEERSYRDFCAEAGIGTAAAKSRAFRARQRLRELLAEAS